MYRETSDDYDRLIAREQKYLDHFRAIGREDVVKDYEESIKYLKNLRKQEVARARNLKRDLGRWARRDLMRHGHKY
jgi:hypothetical protein